MTAARRTGAVRPPGTAQRATRRATTTDGDAPPPIGSGALGGVDQEFSFTGADFDRIRKLIYERAGISLSDGKRNMVYARLSRRLRTHRIASFADYLALLERDDGSEWEAFTNSLTTNLTSFFREAHHFPVLADFLRHRPRRGTHTIWCSAASTGEEPYSIAITACEAFDSLTPPVKIIASDIDTQVLGTAERGVYSEDRLKGLDAGRLRRFFLKGTGRNAGQVRVRRELQTMIEFRQINLLGADWGISAGLAAIFCRNVMIYFDHATQHTILQRFAPLLARDGLLFAGHSESFTHSTRIFRLRGKTVYEHASLATG